MLDLTLTQYMSYIKGISAIKRAEAGQADNSQEEISMRNNTKVLEAQVELQKKMTGKKQFKLDDVIK